MSDKEKENQVQEAIGTMKRQMYIACGSGTDLEELFDGFRQAIQNFGLFMYNDPSNELYAFIISNENLIAGDGGKFLRVVKEGGSEKWYLADQEEIMTATFFRIVSVYVAMALLKSMEGTFLESGLKHVWEIVTGQLKPSIKTRLELFDRQIRYSGFGRKSYIEKNEALGKILKGMDRRERERV